jgi:hypothetical protein
MTERKEIDLEFMKLVPSYIAANLRHYIAEKESGYASCEELLTLIGALVHERNDALTSTAGAIEQAEKRGRLAGFAECRERAKEECERIEDFYQLRDGHKYPELQDPAPVGARECYSAIADLQPAEQKEM